MLYGAFLQAALTLRGWKIWSKSLDVAHKLDSDEKYNVGPLEYKTKNLSLNSEQKAEETC